MRNKIAAVLLTLSMLTGSSAPVSAGEELIWSGTDQVDAIVTENRIDSSRDITEETFRYEMDEVFTEAGEEEKDEDPGDDLLSAGDAMQEDEDLTLIGLSEEYMQYSTEEHQGMTPDPNEGKYPALPMAGATSYVVESAVQWAIGIANDQTHGYSMASRWGPDYDCSSLVIAAYRHAGLELTGALYTGNMVSVFKQYGFTCYSAYSLGANSGYSQLQRGDILLDPVNHTEIYIGNGQLVGAHSNIPSASHPNRSSRTGDQGDEISVCRYYVFPWTYVLRYTGTDHGVEMTSGYGQTIPDGDYVITSAMDPLFYMDITGAADKAPDGKNVRLWSVTDRSGYDRLGIQDVWTVTYGSDGFYTIAQKGTTKVLEVADAGRSEKDNVQVAENNKTSGQRWAIRQADTGDGYQVSPKCSGLCLAADGNADRSTNVCQDFGKDTPAQSWEFIPYKPAASLPDGKYVLQSALSATLQLDVAGSDGQATDGTNVRVWNETKGKNVISRYNIFDVKSIGNGYYRLTHAGSGKVLDLPAQRIANDTTVHLWKPLNNNFGQQWAITPQGDGYVLRARCSGQALSVADGQTSNGNDVVQSFWTGTAAQIWKFVPADSLPESESSAQAAEITHVFNSVKGGDIRWNKVHGASGYVVYRQRSAEGTIKVATITDPDAEQCFDEQISKDCWGRVYHYFVRPLYGTTEGPASVKLPLQRLAPMRVTALKNTASGEITCSFSCTVKDNKAQGYEIQYAQSQDDLTGRKGTFGSQLITGRATLTAVLKKLEKNKTWYIRVRAFTDYTNSATGQKSRIWSQYSNTMSKLIW